MKGLTVLIAGLLVCAFASTAAADYYDYNGDWRSVYLTRNRQPENGYYNYSGDWRVTYNVPKNFAQRQRVPQSGNWRNQQSGIVPQGYLSYGPVLYGPVILMPLPAPQMTTHVSRSRYSRFCFAPHSKNHPPFTFGYRK